MTDEVTKAKAARWDRQMAEAVVEAVKASVADPKERIGVLAGFGEMFRHAAVDASREWADQLTKEREVNLRQTPTVDDVKMGGA